MSPEVSQTSVVLDFLQSLKIFSELSINTIGNKLRCSSVSWAVLSVQEPFWNAMLSWSLKDVVDSLDLSLSNFTSSLVEVNTCGLEDHAGHSAAYTLDGSEGESDFDCTFHVGVLDTEDVHEIVGVDHLDLLLRWVRN